MWCCSPRQPPSAARPWLDSSKRSLDPHLAHVHRGARAGRLRCVHRAEHLGSGLHVLSVLEVLKDHRGSLAVIKQDLEAGGGNPGGRSVGLLDASKKLLHPLGRYVGEPDHTHVHDWAPSYLSWNIDHNA